MATIYRFGDFTLDPERRTLRAGEDELVLPESAYLVLETLVRNAPDTVDKKTLMDVGWPDAAVVQDNLVQAVHTIRSVLGGNAKKPRFVQTVHRRGYRFVAPVTRIERDPGAPDSPLATVGQEATRPRSRGRRAARWVVAALLTAAAVAVVVTMGRNSSVEPHHVRTIAVLPLDNLSGDPEQEYFADGMTDALITELARLDTVDVISRTSVMRFKDTRRSVPEIAGELGVDAVVEGTVTRFADRVRVIAQLVDSSDRHIWGESYEAELSDVLQLQRAVSVAIAEEIGARIDPEPNAASPSRVDPRAHEAVLRGNYVLRDRTEEAIRRAQAYFRQAIDVEPSYAPAYAGLAYSYNILANYGFAPSTEARPLARAAAERAVSLNPGLADAHLALALVAAEYDWDFETAEREFQLALSQQPSSPVARSGYAHLLVALGDLDRAVEELRRAHRLDPLSEIIAANIGWLLALDRRDVEAEQKLTEVLEFNPDFAVAQYYLGVLYDRQGRWDEAIAALTRARELSRDASYAAGGLAHALARSGRVAEARTILDELLQRSRTTYVSPVGLAVAHFGLGETDEAFARLRQAFVERKGWLLHLAVEPALDGYRDDPRYRELIDEIGLPDSRPPAAALSPAA